MKIQHQAQFGGFVVGSVAAAALLAYGITLLVATVNYPLAAAGIVGLNFIMRRGWPDAVLLTPSALSWIITAYTGITGTACLFLGLRLAGWVARRTTEETPSSTHP